MTKQITISSKEITETKEYKNLLQELQSIINTGLYSAYKSVDNIKVQTYWKIGERIVREELQHQEKAVYGRYLIQNLAIDLKITRRDLYRIVKFYKYYQIVGSVIPQLSWTHYYQLVDIDNERKRIFYQNKAVQNSWSVRELKKQIKNQLYERLSPEEIQATFQTKLPAIETTEVFKDTYDFKFIELTDQSEKELETKLMEKFELFLQELGEDIAILKRQAPIKINNKTHHIDIVLFHCGIPCKILVDLKIGEFKIEYVGQMNNYVNYYRQNKQYEYEKDTIGLIICQHAGKEEIRYALGGLEEKIFIAKYKVKLPSEEKIKKAIKKLS